MEKQRELKFRAWDKEKMVMSSPFTFGSLSGFDDETGTWVYFYDSKEKITIDFTNSDKSLLYNLIIMQYTGLKDNTTWEELTEEERSQWTLDGNMPSEWNGKEIYESDTLDVEINGFICENKEIKYIDSGFWIENEAGEHHLPAKEFRKVIGNIYQNKELLKNE